MVDLIIPLFYKPAWEIELEGRELDVRFSDELRNLGDELRDRLYRAAELHEKLLENGWKAIGGQYEITYHKDLTIEEAQKEIQQLQIEKYLSSLTKHNNNKKQNQQSPSLTASKPTQKANQPPTPNSKSTPSNPRNEDQNPNS